jgi:hypothetical protein
MIQNKGTGKGTDDRLVRIEGVIKGCEEILADPAATPVIKKCATDTAYKHIVKIMKEEWTACSDS